MTQARRTLISLADTPYYHCITRCVRRAFLCGHDSVNNRTFDHRKVWLAERFKMLSTIFAIDICAYAVMSNHYHLVVYIDEQKADTWSDEEVVERWGKLFKTSAQTLENKLLFAQSPTSQDAIGEKVKQWRSNLQDISWFMKCLNEYIARRCNKEDDCKGHFWEARFKSQALLDEKALLSCMAYVDLNPVRAAMVDTPEESDFTSIQERLIDHANRLKARERSQRQKALLMHYRNYYEKSCKTGKKSNQGRTHSFCLKPFGGSAQLPLSDALPITLQDYFELVEDSGRIIRQDKRGEIPNQLPTILARMGFEEKSWLDSIQGFMDQYASVAGSLEALRNYEDRGSLKGIKGVGFKGKRAA